METFFCEFTDTAIQIEKYIEAISHPAHGAQVLFFGVIRNLNFGKKVLAVSYDLFRPLANATFRTICQEALRDFPKIKIALIHRTGTLKVGEIAILTAVSSPHRDEAYRASRIIIEGVKHKAPIWKKEHYESGESEWVKGHALCQGHSNLPE